MNRWKSGTRWMLAASALGVLAMSGVGVRAQGEKPQPASPQEESKKGTGVVPPGVKLEGAMPAGLPAKPFQFPHAAERTLANGLRVFVITDHRQPAVAARLVLTAAGTIHDPADLPGVAAMTANLLTQGTEKRSAPQIAEAIDFVGGSLSAGAGSDSTTVTAGVVRKDLDLAMDLLSDVVLHPAFRKEELDRQRQQLLSALQVQYNDPGYLATAAVNRVVYGPSAYGWPEQGTPQTIAKLDGDALARFHDANYVPNQALLALAGDITPEAGFAVVEKYFGGWQKKNVAASAPAAPEPPSGLRFIVIDKPDAVQTQIRVARPGIPRNSPDYIPLLVANRIFGGGFNSRLNTAVRVQKGLTYGASSSFGAHRTAGIFSAATFTRTEATVEATRLVVDLIAQMSTGDVTPAEMNFARDYLAGVYPIQSETADQVAGRVLTVAEFGLAGDYNDTYQRKILAVGADEVNIMAARYFDARNLDLVLVGNASQFRDGMKKAFSDAKWEEIPFEELDLLSADLRKPKATEAAATPEQFDRGRAVLQASAQAAGGAALASVQSVEITGSGQIFIQGQQIPSQTKIQIIYPDHVRSETTVGPLGAFTLGFDGKAAWISSQQGAQDAPPSMFGEFQRSIILSGGWGLYQQILAGKVEAASLGQEDLDGKKADALLWKSPFGDVKLYFDPASHLLVGAHYRSVTPQGASEVDQRWSDFRAVEGRQFPFHNVLLREGEKFADSTIQEVKINPSLDSSLFAKPQATPAPK